MRFLVHAVIVFVALTAGIVGGLWMAKSYFDYSSAEFVSRYVGLMAGAGNCDKECSHKVDTLQRQRMVQLSSVALEHVNQSFSSYAGSVLNLALLRRNGIYTKEDAGFVLTKLERGGQEWLASQDPQSCYDVDFCLQMKTAQGKKP